MALRVDYLPRVKQAGQGVRWAGQGPFKELICPISGFRMWRSFFQVIFPISFSEIGDRNGPKVCWIVCAREFSILAGFSQLFLTGWFSRPVGWART